jgi:predicted transcriptional regulator
MSTGKRRSSAQLARDRRRIANLYLQGWLQADIAEELGISPATVSRDLKALQSEWRKSRLVDIDAAKQRELAKIDRLEREYWVAWERSIGKSLRVTVKGKGTEDKATQMEKTTTTDDLNGDPRYLAGIQWCIDRRCKILGIDAPEKMEHKGTLSVTFISNVDDDQL